MRNQKLMWIVAALDDEAGYLSDQITRIDDDIALYEGYHDALMASCEANDDGECAVARGDLSSWDTMYPIPVIVRQAFGGEQWVIETVDVIGGDIATLPYPSVRAIKE